MSNVRPLFANILARHIPPSDPDAVARELARHHIAQIWASPVKLHRAAGEYMTDLSMDVCADLVHVRSVLGSEHPDTHLALLKLFRSLEKCVHRSVRVVAESRAIGEALDASDYTGNPDTGPKGAA